MTDEKSGSFEEDYFNIFNNLARSAIDAAPNDHEAYTLFMKIAAYSLSFIFENNAEKFPRFLAVILASLGTLNEENNGTPPSES